MNAILVDDEDLALRLFEATISKIENVNYMGGFSSCEKALEFAAFNKIDVAFLDIEMQEMTGLELAKKLYLVDSNIKIVFVTGYERYAYQAFNVNAAGYLLKPYSVKDLNLVLERLQKSIPTKKRIKIVTMPRFDVFVDGKIIQFERAKAKEYLALLVDRQGGEATSDYIATYLYENRPYDESTKIMCRVALSSLVKTLKNLNCAELIVSKKNLHSIETSIIDCDIINLYNNDAATVKQYSGEYMLEYEWAQETNERIKKYLNYIDTI